MSRFTYPIWDFLGYWLCEFAFSYWRWRGERRALLSPAFSLLYRAGCFFSGRATDAALRCGALIPNPKWRGPRDESSEPMYVWAKDLA